jgi:2-oxo-4-hydroxy-4-carboxy-5-ureidoimidazoline decarboxylase
MTLQDFNLLSSEDCRRELGLCCGSLRWVDGMEKARPFVTMDALISKADEIWANMEEKDAMEAFAHHPQIGGVDRLREKFASTRHWAGDEQAGVKEAEEAVLQALAEGNAAYLEKFGYIFIVCATGKTAREMKDLLYARIPNSPKIELGIAMNEQHKITKIRLHKLLS